ncbi:MAG: hypothetical protein HC917_24950 [Richelia sp. SM2_1_7]|nr:hypothetical protein [Richelia sp. SM2_1_7]
MDKYYKMYVSTEDSYFNIVFHIQGEEGVPLNYALELLDKQLNIEDVNIIEFKEIDKDEYTRNFIINLSEN